MAPHRPRARTPACHSLLAALALLALLAVGAGAGDGAVLAVPQCDLSNPDSCRDTDGDAPAAESLVDPTASADPFVATDEWQQVGKDQPIPPGLHVRLSMSTGERWAKLMDEETGIKTLSEKRQEKLELLQPLVARDTANATMEQSIVDYSAWVEKHRAAKKKLWTQSSRQISASLDEFQATADTARRTALLLELEELVHDMEASAEFARQGGLSLLLLLLGDEGPEPTQDLQAAAALVLGAMCQNNPDMQTLAGKQGATALLVKAALRSEERAWHTALRRLIFALSALARSGSPARPLLHLNELLPLLPTQSGPARSKLLKFVSDLIVGEALEALPADSDPDSLLGTAQRAEPTLAVTQMEGRAPEWCGALFQHLAQEQRPDRLETTAKALLVMGPACVRVASPEAVSEALGTVDGTLSQMAGEEDVAGTRAVLEALRQFYQQRA